MTDLTILETETTYTVHYEYPSCFDDGGEGHDLSWHSDEQVIEVGSDEEAIRVAQTDEAFNQKERCYHGRRRYPVKAVKRVVETAEGGWVRDVSIDLPTPTLVRRTQGQTYRV